MYKVIWLSYFVILCHFRFEFWVYLDGISNVYPEGWCLKYMFSGSHTSKRTCLCNYVKNKKCKHF